jgi:hypothetical protein
MLELDLLSLLKQWMQFFVLLLLPFILLLLLLNNALENLIAGMDET